MAFHGFINKHHRWTSPSSPEKNPKKKTVDFEGGRQAIFSMLGDVYIVLEGGPNVAAQVTRKMMGNELQKPVNIEI